MGMSVNDPMARQYQADTAEDFFGEPTAMEWTALDHAIIGRSAAMVEVKRKIVSLGRSDLTVLICGESGTGKDLIARAIHEFSPRSDRPFVKVNSPGLPAKLFESELFGYERGAFTGAFRKSPGKFRLADSGTIFLDEIAEIPLSMQSKLLQVLEEKQFSSLGSVANTLVDVRILSATNADLEKLVRERRFRLDLFFRLNVVSIQVPPLRERKDDIDRLADHFFKKYAHCCRNADALLPERFRAQFHEYDWPGNVRELENTIRRATALGAPERIDRIIPAPLSAN